jgi:GNAT superfamily N-acetyltransferase
VNLESLYEELSRETAIVSYSPGYRFDDFDCGIDDYNDFLSKDAPGQIKQNVVQVKLLINTHNADIVGYMALCSDSFNLDPNEKERMGLSTPVNTVPALKIGKLAVCQQYTGKRYGSLMLYLVTAYVEKLNDIGVGCRFLVVDADVQNNPGVEAFYVKNGFVDNEKVNRTRTITKSMRYDVFAGA